MKKKPEPKKSGALYRTKRRKAIKSPITVADNSLVLREDPVEYRVNHKGHGLTVLDLFCGAGGISEGFRLAGFRPLGGTDIDPDAIATYALNFRISEHAPRLN